VEKKRVKREKKGKKTKGERVCKGVLGGGGKENIGGTEDQVVEKMTRKKETQNQAGAGPGESHRGTRKGGNAGLWEEKRDADKKRE